ncbi:alpha/beta-hydrolase [Phellopilus nigrolimitatus]|nr:alpha/beta-hydrolase [Phellopilus nigrolimitatus]
MSFPLLSRPLARFQLQGALRRYISSRPPGAPVDLKYDVYNGPLVPQADKGPLLILHGLFGSKRNWQSIGKALAKRIERPVVPIDLRNFGDSPRREQMDYLTMASDVIHFCQKHSLKNISLLGHSMGGKVAMSVALNPSLPKDMVTHLIVADISPIRAPLSHEFPGYVDGMIKIQDEESTKSRNEAFEKLYEYEQNSLIRQFLLTNLASTPAGEPVKFHVPLHTIRDSLLDIGDFPYGPGEASWDGPTLFIKGSMSNYIQLKHLDIIRQFFPRMTMETFEAGHWGESAGTC